MLSKFLQIKGILLVLLVASWSHGAVVDLGAVGATYPVSEPDIEREMHKEAQALEAERAKYLVAAGRYQPADLYPLARAKGNRSFLVDMSYTLEHDLRDRDKKVLYPKGFTFNPLDYTRLSQGVVVIDPTDADQLNWYKGSPYRENRQMKLLISAGYARDLIEELQRPVFYLTRQIAKRLHLQASPCVAVQKGREMQITEFDPRERR